jgi:hypothetical protein
MFVPGPGVEICIHRGNWEAAGIAGTVYPCRIKSPVIAFVFWIAASVAVWVLPISAVPCVKRKKLSDENLFFYDIS